MSGRNQTGHNQMLKRRRQKRVAKKRVHRVAKAAKKLRNQKSK
jgi:hypothetical protein